MRRPILLALALTIALSAMAHAQDSTALSQVTLYSFIFRKDSNSASVKFDSGLGAVTAKECEHSDLMYGNIIVNDVADWFQVCNPRSRIVDLGSKQWKDFPQTPSSFNSKKPQKPLPLNAPFVVDVSGGSKEASPYQQYARVQKGHMYLMRMARGQARIYVMFRVDDLKTKDNCLLSWKGVPPPVGEEKTEPGLEPER